jgi:N-acetylglucosamine kinase-like BadF-type ATPase
VRRHFALQDDLDLCAAIYGKSMAQRSELAQLSKLVAEAASAGDAAARALFVEAARELADIVDAVRDQLRVPADVDLPVSYSGGVFQLRHLLLTPLEAALASRARKYRFLAARLPPDAGAALQAAKLGGTPLDAASIAALEAQVRP